MFLRTFGERRPPTERSSRILKLKDFLRRRAYEQDMFRVIERKNRTLMDMSRTMLEEYKTSDRFWAEAINTTCYSINRLYLHRILKKISYELLTGKKPNVYYF
jgi:reverse gyrase